MPAADRLPQLAAAVARQPGEWTTGRVMRWYRAAGIPAPKRTIARGDLKRLAARGLLTRHDGPGRTYYTPATTDPKGAAQ